ncbi:hypothetical protein FB451DRAFT_1397591 [Mycena latifolia]|nr:hypothetical protein FB451DRAFT_1397591 [Mycena latifolia]
MTVCNNYVICRLRSCPAPAFNHRVASLKLSKARREYAAGHYCWVYSYGTAPLAPPGTLDPRFGGFAASLRPRVRRFAQTTPTPAGPSSLREQRLPTSRRSPDCPQAIFVDPPHPEMYAAGPRARQDANCAGARLREAHLIAKQPSATAIQAAALKIRTSRKQCNALLLRPCLAPYLVFSLTSTLLCLARPTRRHHLYFFHAPAADQGLQFSFSTYEDAPTHRLSLSLTISIFANAAPSLPPDGGRLRLLVPRSSHRDSESARFSRHFTARQSVAATRHLSAQARDATRLYGAAFSTTVRPWNLRIAQFAAGACTRAG